MTFTTPHLRPPAPARVSDAARVFKSGAFAAKAATVIRGATFFIIFAALGGPAHAEPFDRLIDCAREQIGVTVHYDSGYRALSYPGGDVPSDRGVCTDVLIRAFRCAGLGDLQKAVHEDMRRSFSSYPALWKLKGPDRNIDHRRVPNLQRYFERLETSIPVSQRPSDYRPGDIVTSMLPGNLPHIMLVSDRQKSGEPLVIHNIGAGTREEGALFSYPITGHYRVAGPLR